MGQDTSKGAEVRDVMAKAFKVRHGKVILCWWCTPFVAVLAVGCFLDRE